MICKVDLTMGGLGAWDGPSCTECKPNYLGKSCSGMCSGITLEGKPCSGHGECDDGVEGTGQCSCYRS